MDFIRSKKWMEKLFKTFKVLTNLLFSEHSCKITSKKFKNYFIFIWLLEAINWNIFHSDILFAFRVKCWKLNFPFLLLSWKSNSCHFKRFLVPYETNWNNLITSSTFQYFQRSLFLRKTTLLLDLSQLYYWRTNALVHIFIWKHNVYIHNEMQHY